MNIHNSIPVNGINRFLEGFEKPGILVKIKA